MNGADPVTTELPPPGMRPWSGPNRSALAALIVVTVLVAGAVSALTIVGGPTVRGVGVAAPMPHGPHTLPVDRRFDPCTMIDSNALGFYGLTLVDRDRGHYGGCEASILGAGSHETYVGATLLGPGRLRPTVQGTRQPGGTVYREPAFDQGCQRIIGPPRGTPADSISVNILVRFEEEDAPAAGDPCGLANSVTDSALQALRTAKPSDPPRASKNPITAVDACDLLDRVDLAEYPAIDAEHRRQGFGGWGCLWGTPENEQPGVEMIFGRDTALDSTPDNGPSYQREGDGYCVVALNRARFRGADGDDRIETVTLYVYGGDRWNGRRACDVGDRLATVVLRNLPPVQK